MDGDGAAEVEALRRELEEKEEEIGRLSSLLAAKKVEQQEAKEEGRGSQHEEELEGQLDQLIADISELATGLVVAEEGKMRAEVALEDLKTREDVAAEIDKLVSVYILELTLIILLSTVTADSLSLSSMSSFPCSLTRRSAELMVMRCSMDRLVR